MKRKFIVDSYNTRRTGGLHGGDLLHVPALRGAQVLQGAPHAPVLQVVHTVHTVPHHNQCCGSGPILLDTLWMDSTIFSDPDSDL